MVGRVGDSPLFGCGAYANAYGGCSSTGHGESLIRGTICRDVSIIEFNLFRYFEVFWNVLL